MTKSILYVKNRDENNYRVIVEKIADWEGFDKLVRYLEINFHATLLNSYDGPDARRWIFSIEDIKIELIHSDGYGNYFFSETDEGRGLITKIGEDLEERLKDI